MTPAGRLDLRAPRDLGTLLGDALRLYGRHLRTFVALAAAVVIPAELVVFGVGLEQLTSGFDSSPSVGEQVATLAVTYLVIAPLITAMTIHAVLAAGEGRRPRAGESIMAGLDAFARVFAAVLLAGLGIAAGLLLLIVPGIYLGVRWYFVPQAVVIERRGVSDALRASWELVTGAWWRVFGIGLVAGIVAVLPLLAIQAPFQAAAKSADAAWLSLAGSIVADTLATPFVALVATLLYFDLRGRRAGVPAAASEGPPDPPGMPPP